MAAKRHLGDRGEVPNTVPAGVSVNRRLGDKDRFRIPDVGRDGLHPGVVEAGCVQDYSRWISAVGGGGKGGITKYVGCLIHCYILGGL